MVALILTSIGLAFFGGYRFRNIALPVSQGNGTALFIKKGGEKWYEVGTVQCIREEDAFPAAEGHQ